MAEGDSFVDHGAYLGPRSPSPAPSCGTISATVTHRRSPSVPRQISTHHVQTHGKLLFLLPPAETARGMTRQAPKRLAAVTVVDMCGDARTGAICPELIARRCSARGRIRLQTRQLGELLLSPRAAPPVVQTRRRRALPCATPKQLLRMKRVLSLHVAAARRRQNTVFFGLVKETRACDVDLGRRSAIPWSAAGTFHPSSSAAPRGGKR